MERIEPIPQPNPELEQLITQAAGELALWWYCERPVAHVFYTVEEIATRLNIPYDKTTWSPFLNGQVGRIVHPNIRKIINQAKLENKIVTNGNDL